MKKIFFSSIFYFFLIFIFVLIFWVIISPNLRVKIFTLSSGIINNYYSIIIDNNLRSKNNLNLAINKLEQQIKLTDYITTKNKNSFLDNIYFNAKKIEKFIIKDEDYLKFIKVVEILIQKDPDIYNALIWEAKILNFKNIQPEKIINNIDQAINLSASDPEIYRFALNHTQKKNNELFSKYCSLYHKSFQGGSTLANNKSSFFRGLSLSNFLLGININEHNQKFYPINGVL